MTGQQIIIGSHLHYVETRIIVIAPSTPVDSSPGKSTSVRPSNSDLLGIGQNDVAWNVDISKTPKTRNGEILRNPLAA